MKAGTQRSKRHCRRPVGRSAMQDGDSPEPAPGCGGAPGSPVPRPAETASSAAYETARRSECTLIDIASDPRIGISGLSGSVQCIWAPSPRSHQIRFFRAQDLLRAIPNQATETAGTKPPASARARANPGPAPVVVAASGIWPHGVWEGSI
jgi:hypothetical protein